MKRIVEVIKNWLMEIQVDRQMGVWPPQEAEVWETE